MTATVDILLRTPGGPAAAQGAAKPEDDKDKEKRDKDEEKETQKKPLHRIFSAIGSIGGWLKKKSGIQFSLGAFLKQSQVFTSFMGTIYQLFGALVDVILAPLIPIFYPLIKYLASWLPHLQKWMQSFAKELFMAWDRFTKAYENFENYVKEKYGEFKAAWDKGPGEFAKAIGAEAWKGIQWFGDKLWNTALPALGNFLTNFLTSEFGRFFGFFAQAYIMLGWFRNFSNWIGLQFSKLVAKGPMAILRILGRFGAGFLKTMFPGFGHIMVWGLKKIFGIVPLLLKGGMGVVNWIFKTAIPNVLKGFGAIFKKLFGESIGSLLKRIGKALTNVPIFGKAFKALAEMGPGIKMAAKGSKAIPVLGAVATLGFGVAETIQNTKKYGLAAGLATAGKTALATGLAAGGQTYASLAVDMGGSLAINELAKRGMLGNTKGVQEQYRQDVNVSTTNVIKTNDGRTLQEEVIVTQQDDTTSESDLSKLLSANQVN